MQSTVGNMIFSVCHSEHMTGDDAAHCQHFLAIDYSMEYYTSHYTHHLFSGCGRGLGLFHCTVDQFTFSTFCIQLVYFVDG